MKDIIITTGALYGALSVVFGAFGAHALKKRFSKDLQRSFETGVKYQMYHALVLLIIGFELDFVSTIEQMAAWAFILGVFLFSFSIYGLCITSARGAKFSLLGPITPLGGLFLMIGWSLLVLNFTITW